MRVSISSFSEFEKIATAEGLTPNQLILTMAESYRDKQYFVPKEILDSSKQLSLYLRSISNNINQIAIKSHLFWKVKPQEVFTFLEDMNKKIKEYVSRKP